jgi:hypothetical protein
VAGLPDTDSLGTYGGALANYSNVVDPTTDESADYRNLYAMNVAMMTHTVWRACRSFLGPTAGSTGIADPTSGFVHDSLWGASADVKSIGTYVASGIVDMIWPTMVSDELGTLHTLSFKRAIAQVESSDGTFYYASAKVTGPYTVRIYTYNGTTLANIPGQIVTAWVR